MEQIKIAYEFINKSLPVELLNLFKLNSEVHSYLTRNFANKGLHIPQMYTTSFGEKSLKYSAAVIWNRFIEQHYEINNIKSFGALKHYTFESAYKDN